MTKRILLSMVALGLAASLVGGATMALLTAMSDSTSISVQSGSVTIGATGLTAWLTPNNLTWSTPIEDMAPGQTARSTVTVHNAGSLPLKYRVLSSVTGGLNGWLTVAVMSTGNPFTTGQLAAGASQVLTVEVTLPANADSTAKSKNATITLNFDATQVGNSDWP
jgi:hypothetical protein